MFIFLIYEIPISCSEEVDIGRLENSPDHLNALMQAIFILRKVVGIILIMHAQAHGLRSKAIGIGV